MKSKTSFFNKAIFKKNVTLYWPIWVCYLLYGLVKIPGSIWSGLRQNVITEGDRLETLASALNLRVDIYVVAFVAVITGMALFGYLFTTKSANMIHALPVTRTELFFTNVVSGLSFMLIPQLLVFFVSVFVGLFNGITSIELLGVWLLSVMGAAFLFYGIVCFCAMFTGQMFALPVYFGVFNYLSVGLCAGTRYILSFLGYGVSFSDISGIPFLNALSPLDYFAGNVYFKTSYQMDEKERMVAKAISLHGSKVVLCYVGIAVLFYLFAWYCYKKRRIECTGDLLTFGWVKPVFRWGVGVCLGYFVGILASEFLGAVSIWVSKPALFALILILGLVGFFIAEMFVQKSFRVFELRRWKECSLFLVFLSASFAVIYGIGYHVEQYIPDKEQIAYAYISMNYPVEFTGKDVDCVINLQKEILEQKKEFLREKGTEQDFGYLTLNYCLKNGHVITRSYRIPSGVESSVDIANKITGYESEPDNFMTNLAGDDYDHITKVLDGQLEISDENADYTTYELDQDCAKKIYAALLKDVEEGTIQKYNLGNYLMDPDQEDTQYSMAYLNIYIEHSTIDWKDSYGWYNERIQSADKDYEYTEGPDTKRGSVYVNFGEECTNIIRTLIDEGVIASEKELNFSAASDR